MNRDSPQTIARRTFALEGLALGLTPLDAEGSGHPPAETTDGG